MSLAVFWSTLAIEPYRQPNVIVHRASRETTSPVPRNLVYFTASLSLICILAVQLGGDRVGGIQADRAN